MLPRHLSPLVAGTLLWLLAAASASARPGLGLDASVAIARKAKVPLAVFVLREHKVVAEEWHSYTTPTQETGPAWNVGEAHRLRGLLMGHNAARDELARKVSWASFPVWCFAYPDGHWLIYESKRRTQSVWALLAVINWFWAGSISPGFVEPDGCESWKLLNGKLIALSSHSPQAPPASPRPGRRPSSNPDFPSLFP